MTTHLIWRAESVDGLLEGRWGIENSNIVVSFSRPGLMWEVAAWEGPDVTVWPGLFRGGIARHGFWRKKKALAHLKKVLENL